MGRIDRQVRRELRGSLSSRPLGGCFRGRVEYNLDPLRMGRCKVRVLQVHGTNEEVGTVNLPWASPMFGRVSEGSGDVSVPLVGSRVWVFFENGDKKYPVYGGGVMTVPREGERYHVVLDKNGQEYPSGDRPLAGYMTASGPYGPREGHRMVGNHPDSRVVKTPGGHTLYMEDRPQSECLKLVDRFGQQLVFEAYSNRLGGHVGRGLSDVSFDGLDADENLGKFVGMRLEGLGGAVSIESEGEVSVLRLRTGSCEVMLSDDGQMVAIRSGGALVMLSGESVNVMGDNVVLSGNRVVINSHEMTILGDKVSIEGDKVDVKDY